MSCLYRYRIGDDSAVGKPVPAVSSSRGTASGSGGVVFQEQINRIAA